MDVIDTSTMPGDNVYPDVIDAAAGRIRASGAAVSTTATSTHTAWTAISGAYEAPEQGQLYAAMNPVKSEAEVFKTDLGSAATALETFAETVRTIKAAVSKIRGEVTTFENKIASDGSIQPAGGYNPYGGGMKLRIQWNEDTGMVAEHNRLTAAINAQSDALRAAEITCADSISDITGAAHLPTSGPGAPPAAPHMADAQWYLTAPIDREEDCGQRIAHGVVIDWVGGGVSGLLGLVGVDFDTTTGKFGNFFTTLGNSWGGLVKFGVGANPLLWGVLGGLGADKYVAESRRTAWGFLNDQVARDPFAKDPWHRYKEDPLRAGSYTLVNLATWLLPPVKALTAAKASKAAELAGDAAKVGDAAKAGTVTRFGSAADLVKALRESGSLKSLTTLSDAVKAKLGLTAGKASDLAHLGDDLKTPKLSEYDLTGHRANPHTEVPAVRDGRAAPTHTPAHEGTPAHDGDRAHTSHDGHDSPSSDHPTGHESVTPHHDSPAGGSGSGSTHDLGGAGTRADPKRYSFHSPAEALRTMPEPDGSTLATLKSYKEYAPGTAEHMNARWKAYEASPNTSKLSWEAWRNGYVAKQGNHYKGLAFEDVVRHEKGLTLKDGWREHVKVKLPAVRNYDLYNAPLAKAWEIKAGGTVDPAQLAKDAIAVRRGTEVHYVFGKEPTAAAIHRMERAGVTWEVLHSVGVPVG